MRVRPTGQRLMVKLSEYDKHEYKGKIIIPDNARQRVRVFEVVDVGPTADLYKVGDLVVISFYTGIYLDLIQGVDPENLRIINQDEIIAYIEKE